MRQSTKPPGEDQKITSQDRAHGLTKANQLTEEEVKNGWTREALAKYHAEMESITRQLVFGVEADKGKRRPVRVISTKSFSPHGWLR